MKIINVNGNLINLDNLVATADKQDPQNPQILSVIILRDNVHISCVLSLHAINEIIMKALKT